ncbi:hypothetical protein BC832DRAFT_615593 [Gaertneriomyces semiglobifer]|nr:hypothetical protein BC832DRAFT_615593 [Gaertneriomyces semiglobifer]
MTAKQKHHTPQLTIPVEALYNKQMTAAATFQITAQRPQDRYWPVEVFELILRDLTLADKYSLVQTCHVELKHHRNLEAFWGIISLLGRRICYSRSLRIFINDPDWYTDSANRNQLISFLMSEYARALDGVQISVAFGEPKRSDPARQRLFDYWNFPTTPAAPRHSPPELVISVRRLQKPEEVSCTIEGVLPRGDRPALRLFTKLLHFYSAKIVSLEIVDGTSIREKDCIQLPVKFEDFPRLRRIDVHALWTVSWARARVPEHVLEWNTYGMDLYLPQWSQKTSDRRVSFILTPWPGPERHSDRLEFIRQQALEHGDFDSDRWMKLLVASSRRSLPLGALAYQHLPTPNIEERQVLEILCRALGKEFNKMQKHPGRVDVVNMYIYPANSPFSSVGGLWPPYNHLKPISWVHWQPITFVTSRYIYAGCTLLHAAETRSSNPKECSRKLGEVGVQHPTPGAFIGLHGTTPAFRALTKEHVNAENQEVEAEFPISDAELEGDHDQLGTQQVNRQTPDWPILEWLSDVNKPQLDSTARLSREQQLQHADGLAGSSEDKQERREQDDAIPPDSPKEEEITM